MLDKEITRSVADNIFQIEINVSMLHHVIKHKQDKQ